MIWRREDAEAAHATHAEAAPRERKDARMADNNGEVTIIGAGARLEGNVVSAGSLRIDGQIKGQIYAVVAVSVDDADCYVNACEVGWLWLLLVNVAHPVLH
jgi:cytoskeletal protein CcmA (bactofilin family)